MTKTKVAILAGGVGSSLSEETQLKPKPIVEILGNRERAREMGNAGRRKAIEQFSCERTADLLLERFQTLVNLAVGRQSRPLRPSTGNPKKT